MEQPFIVIIFRSNKLYFQIPLFQRRSISGVYNFTKKHSALGRKTPAEASLIEIDGRNRWIPLIQNASLYEANSI